MADRKKAVIYTRVSTDMQVDGFSLDAQLREVTKLCDMENLEVVKVYEEKGKSAKSIEGRPQFQEMLHDIETGTVVCDYVCVYKLSRFGRNATDVLNSLEFIQGFGVNLMCKEDYINSSTEMGSFMIKILSAVSEMERQNILVQSMSGRREKAIQGKWNGGFAPYGYTLIDKNLVIVPEEAEVVKRIFELFVFEDMGYTTVAKQLNLLGIKRKKAPNSQRAFEDWYASAVKSILDNPVYCGKMAYGRRVKKKVSGTRNQYRQVKGETPIISEGKHEAIISEEVFELCQIKRKATGVKFTSSNAAAPRNLLSGILRCPDCGSPMYSNKNSWTNKDGTKQDRFYYSCGHSKACKGGECKPNSVRADKMEDEVLEYIRNLVNNKKFADAIQAKIGQKIDTVQLDKELSGYKARLAEILNTKARLEKEIDNCPLDTPYRDKILEDMNKRLYGSYALLDEVEQAIAETEDKKRAVEQKALNEEGVYKILLNFNKVFDRLDGEGQKRLLASFVQKITLNKGEKLEERTINSIIFNFTVILDKDNSLVEQQHVETVVLMSK